MLVLNSIITDADNANQIEEIDNFLFKGYKPSNFAGSDSAEIIYDKQFASMCLLIGQKGHLEAQNMSVLQFYNIIDLIKKQIDAEMKGLKSIKR